MARGACLETRECLAGGVIGWRPLGASLGRGGGVEGRSLGAGTAAHCCNCSGLHHNCEFASKEAWMLGLLWAWVCVCVCVCSDLSTCWAGTRAERDRREGKGGNDQKRKKKVEAKGRALTFF